MTNYLDTNSFLNIILINKKYNELLMSESCCRNIKLNLYYFAVCKEINIYNHWSQNLTIKSRPTNIKILFLPKKIKKIELKYSRDGIISSFFYLNHNFCFLLQNLEHLIVENIDGLNDEIFKIL